MKNVVGIFVVFFFGVGSFVDFEEVFREIGIEVVLVVGIFYWGEVGIDEVKGWLEGKEMVVRKMVLLIV